jgi:hypothetical protein
MPPKAKPVQKHEQSDEEDEEPEAERALTPIEVDFTEHHTRSWYIKELDTLQTVNNNRNAEVYTEEGYTCEGNLGVNQVWDPHARSYYEFRK